jgi:hypothetical protein
MQQRIHAKLVAMSSEQRDKLKKSLSTKLVGLGHVSQAQAPVTSDAIIKYIEGEEGALIELAEHNPQVKVIMGETLVTPVFAIVDGLVGEIPGAGGLIDGAAELGEQAGEISAQVYATRKELKQQEEMLAAARQAPVVAQVPAPVAAPAPAPAAPAPAGQKATLSDEGAPVAVEEAPEVPAKTRPPGRGKTRKRKKRKRKKKGGRRRTRRRRRRRGHRTRRRKRRSGRKRSRRGGSFWKTWIKPDTCNSATDCPTDYPYCHIGRRRGMINFGLLSGQLGQCVS